MLYVSVSVRIISCVYEVEILRTKTPVYFLNIEKRDNLSKRTKERFIGSIYL